MLHTTINITDDTEQYSYVVEYIKNESTKSSGACYLNYKSENFDDKATNFDDVVFCNSDTQYVRNHNNWIEVSTNEKSSKNIPDAYDSGSLRLYFPNHSVDTYDAGVNYALTVSIWIRNRCVVLGTYIFNRTSALACDEVRTFNNRKYYEYIDFNIVDAMSLMYSDDWKDWRSEVCNEPVNNKDLVNSVGSILYISIHPVIKSNNSYCKFDGYNGGQNSINLTNNIEDFLTLKIQPNTWRSLRTNELPGIECYLHCNKYYEGNINEYLIETYGEGIYKFQWEMVVGDEDNIYAIIQNERKDMIGVAEQFDPASKFVFDKELINKYTFENGIGWKPGISIVCSVSIFKDNEGLLYLLSNRLPLNENLLRYFTKTYFNDNSTKGYIVNNVNLDKVNMNFYNINAVNKIENKVIHIDQLQDSKSNIVQPVFFKVVESSNIIIHPEVTEIICINLDQYKSKVKSFILQVEGIKFIEYGRNSSGVLFKIVGNKLPKAITSGVYYILNQDSELVTTGKYSYVQ